MALSPSRQEAQDEAKESVLDAAEECFSKFGTSKTSIANIVEISGVPRTTVYRPFKNRDAIIEGVMLRDVSRLLTDLFQYIAKFSSPEERIKELIIYTMESVVETPRLSAILTSDSALLVASSNRVFAQINFEESAPSPDFILTLVNDFSKIRRDISPDKIKEFLIQSVFGLLTLKTPAGLTKESRREYITNFVIPALFYSPGK